MYLVDFGGAQVRLQLRARARAVRLQLQAHAYSAAQRCSKHVQHAVPSADRLGPATHRHGCCYSHHSACTRLHCTGCSRLQPRLHHHHGHAGLHGAGAVPRRGAARLGPVLPRRHAAVPAVRCGSCCAAAQTEAAPGRPLRREHGALAGSMGGRTPPHPHPCLALALRPLTLRPRPLRLPPAAHAHHVEGLRRVAWAGASLAGARVGWRGAAWRFCGVACVRACARSPPTHLAA